jgi:hypothetical protein
MFGFDFFDLAMAEDSCFDWKKELIRSLLKKNLIV